MGRMLEHERLAPPDGDIGSGRDAQASVAATFDALYAAHHGDVVAMAYVLTGDIHDAHDLAQEAFCRAWQRWRTVVVHDNPVAWVKRVAANLAISQARRRRVARRFLVRQRVDHVTPISADHVAVVTALRALPESTMRAIVLHYIADLPVTEVAEVLGANVGTVKSWLHRGRAALAEHLGDAHSGASFGGDRQ
jgi:RNA polymerase sigma-70 factor (ECF subfamily)